MADAERSTKDKLLDSFEELLVEHGPRSATLEAVASHAGVSKGGLLYHFARKDDLIDGVLERLMVMTRQDCALMREADGGPVRYYLETSVSTGSDFDRALVAAARLGQENTERVSQALLQVRESWLEVLREHLGDESLARTIQLIGDGLYFNDVAGMPDAAALPHIRQVLARLDVPM
ncbi:MAG TPA: TetR/AcrR family transcriptional regulator [Beutenbergiaceae bacterium]|nr:TetR/AcrR family transcriptional regulator [Beutenbergiaceae bacterium]